MTMSASLERVPVERISERAARINTARSILAVFGGLLFLVGYLPAKALRGLAWMGAAVAEGWSEGRTAVKPEGGTDG